MVYTYMEHISFVPKIEFNLSEKIYKKSYDFQFDKFLKFEAIVIDNHVQLVNDNNNIKKQFNTMIDSKFSFSSTLNQFIFKHYFGNNLKNIKIHYVFVGNRLKNQIINDTYLQGLEKKKSNILLRCRFDNASNVLQEETFILMIKKLIDLLEYDIQTLSIDCYYYLFPGMIDLIIYISSFFYSTCLCSKLSNNFTALGQYITFLKPTQRLSPLIKTLKRLVEQNISLKYGFLHLSTTFNNQVIELFSIHFKKYINLKKDIYPKYKKDISADNFLNLSKKFSIRQSMSVLKYNVNTDIKYEQFLKSIKHFKVLNIDDKISINSHISMAEGNMVSKLIYDNKPSNILEIGMGYGIMSLYIILTFIKNTRSNKINKYIFNANTAEKNDNEGNADTDEKNDNEDDGYSTEFKFFTDEDINNNYKPKLVSIDPYQESHWKNIGINFINKYNLQEYHSLKKAPSDIQLPHYYKKHKKFDCIYIHDNNISNNTLVDVYYAIKMLNNNAHLIIENANKYGRSMIINYIDFNFNQLKKTKINNDMLVIYQLITDST